MVSNQNMRQRTTKIWTTFIRFWDHKHALAALAPLSRQMPSEKTQGPWDVGRGCWGSAVSMTTLLHSLPDCWLVLSGLVGRCLDFGLNFVGANGGLINWLFKTSSWDRARIGWIRLLPIRKKAQKLQHQPQKHFYSSWYQLRFPEMSWALNSLPRPKKLRLEVLELRLMQPMLRRYAESFFWRCMSMIFLMGLACGNIMQEILQAFYHWEAWHYIVFRVKLRNESDEQMSRVLRRMLEMKSAV